MSNRTATPFLGTTTDRNAAFPGIAQIKFSVSQDPYGANPRCQQGGLLTQQIVLFHPDGECDFPCNGHEGTPAGRRKGDPCDNRFKVTLEVIRSASGTSDRVNQ